mgnify:CR=1 FL=1
MTSDVARAKVDRHDELVALYARHGGEMPTREQIASELTALGAKGPAAALRNGLDDEENRLLFSTTDPNAIAELVLRGLETLGL